MRHSDCTRCELHKYAKHVGMGGSGNPNAKLMLLGEAPGATEDEQGVPFVGPAGNLLDSAFRRARIPREEVYIANAVRCRPPSNNLKSFPKAVGACSIYTQEDISTIQPRAILAVGGVALKALTGKTAVGDQRWKVLEAQPKLQLGDARVMATWHPAYILRNPESSENDVNATGRKHNVNGLMDDLVQDLTAAWRLANFDYDALPTHKRVILPPGSSFQELVDALSLIAAPQMVTIDCEWTAASDSMCWPWTPGAELYTIGIAARTGPSEITSVSLAWPPLDGGREYLRSFLEQRLHNLHFGTSDGLWMTHEGLPLVLYWDTGLAGFCLDETWRLGLDHLAPLVGGMPPGWKIEKRWYERPRLAVDWSNILTYQGDDCYATQLTFEGELAEIKSRPVWERDAIRRVLTQIMIPAAVEFMDDARTGLPLSMSKIDTHIERLNQKEIMLAEQFLVDIGLEGTTVAEALDIARVPDQTAQYVLRKYGIQLPSTRKDALTELAEQNTHQTDLKRIIDIRHIAKLKGTYLSKWKILGERQGDNALHCITSLTLKTGRTAQETEEGGGPQVTPRGDDLRDVVTAPEGWKILMADESQLELRVIAEVAPESRMREVYGGDDPRLTDLHMTTGTFFKLAESNPDLDIFEYWNNRLQWFEQFGEWKFKDGVWGWSSPVRQPGKSSNFGLAYGMAEEKYQFVSWRDYQVALTLEQARWRRSQHFRLYADLKEWHEHARSDFKRGYYITPTGRIRRHFTSPTEAINGPIQATGNDIVLLARIAVGEEIRKRKLERWVKPIAYLHDAIGAVIVDGAVDEAREFIIHHMEHPPFDRVGIQDWATPLVAETTVAQSWSK